MSECAAVVPLVLASRDGSGLCGLRSCTPAHRVAGDVVEGMGRLPQLGGRASEALVCR